MNILKNTEKRFVLIFTGTLLLGLASVALLNIYINPWQNYGRKGSISLYNARLAKTEYLKTLPRDSLPQVVFLGSSNVMRYKPSTIEKLIGKKAFNFGVYWGRMDDFLCIASFLVNDLQLKPELLIIGLDTWALKEGESDHPVFPGVRRRLLNAPDLVKYDPDISPIPLFWSKIIDLFSFQQTSISLNKFLHGAKRVPIRALTDNSPFNPDGTRESYGDPFGKLPNIREAVDEGDYDIEPYLEKIYNTGVVERFPTFANYAFDSFWDRRIKYLHQLVELCQRKNIKIIFVLDPVHPIFWKVITENTPHLRHLQNLLNMLADLKREYPVILGTVNASRIQYFGGTRQGFYDEIHPSTVNCDLILHKVAEVYRNN